MERRTIVITGANSGIGREAARQLLTFGHEVVLVCRNRDKAEAARADVTQTSGNTLAHVVLCDLASQADIRRAAAELLERFPRIHALVNNAGLINTDRSETVDGHEATLAVNHLAPMLLTHLLKDRLVASSPARVITVSSDYHWRGRVDFDDLQSKAGYAQFSVYANSKLMNVLFTRELARRLAGTGVVANAMHPGLVQTNLGPQKGFFKLAYPLATPFMISAAKGADTITWLASAPEAAHVSGEYFCKRKVRLSSPRSKNMDVARRLWEVSAHLVGT
jgi:NAD(P)-dependent dehydrogenase (short-subunit alcohol dehydrogenase family)